MSNSGSLRAGAFIDRDGVINEERAYVHRVEDFVILPNAVAGMRILSQAGYVLVVVTNQAGVAHGYYDERQVVALHEHMCSLLSSEGVSLDGILYCPHHPQGTVAKYRRICECRKPAPGMILDASRSLHLNLAKSVMIGDKRGDVEAGRAAGVGLNLLVQSGHDLSADDVSYADAVCDDLLDAARFAAIHKLSGYTT